ncbi:MAG: ABC transporter substrate-binding protein [Alphaproteobacteria bacterium]|nr:ABC transporter substrate-binding protein [Alphaproteobacteria bacterium]
MSQRLWVGLTIVLLCAGWAMPSAAAPDPQRAKTFVQEGLNEAFDVLRAKGKSKQQKSDNLRVLLRQKFDVNTIGKFALGVYRRQTSDAQMEAYLEAFEEYLVQVYINRIVSYTPEKDDDAGEILTVTGTRPATKTDIFVMSVLKRAGVDPQPIQWRVRNSKDRLVVIDVTIEGTSQALTYKQEFASVIQKRGQGVDGLIAELREKNDRYRADGKLNAAAN